MVHAGDASVRTPPCSRTRRRLLPADPRPPRSASAQGWTCEASALAATLGPCPKTEPVTANRSAPACNAAQAGRNFPATPLPVTGTLLSATTGLEPATGTPSAQTASAAAGLGSLAIAGLPIPIPPPDLSGLPGPQTIPGVGTIGPALQGQGASARRRQPALRGPPGEDPLHRLRQGRRAPALRSSGLFRATAPLPPARLRATNRARYRAEIANEKSLRLKLVRRMLVSGTTVKGRRVTIAGRIVRPLGQPVRQVIVKRRLSCGRFRVVKRFTPRSSGAFRVTLAGPPSSQAAAYRLQTRVRKFTTNPKVFPTFTLPRYVDLAQP